MISVNDKMDISSKKGNDLNGHRQKFRYFYTSGNDYTSPCHLKVHEQDCDH